MNFIIKAVIWSAAYKVFTLVKDTPPMKPIKDSCTKTKNKVKEFSKSVIKGLSNGIVFVIDTI